MSALPRRFTHTWRQHSVARCCVHAPSPLEFHTNACSRPKAHPRGAALAPHENSPVPLSARQRGSGGPSAAAKRCHTTRCPSLDFSKSLTSHDGSKSIKWQQQHHELSSTSPSTTWRRKAKTEPARLRSLARCARLCSDFSPASSALTGSRAILIRPDPTLIPATPMRVSSSASSGIDVCTAR